MRTPTKLFTRGDAPNENKEAPMTDDNRRGGDRPRSGGPRRDDSSGRPRNSGSGRTPSRGGGAASGAGRSSSSKPPRSGDSRPRRDGDSRPRRDSDGRPPRSGDGRPRRDGPPRSGSSRAGGGRPSGRPGSRGRDRDTDEARGPRYERAPRAADKIEAPEIPEDVTFGDLDKVAKARLRTLSKDNAEDVGRHLVMAGLMIDHDPELAYQHAQVAVQRAGRVDIVREAAALTAYATGRYAEALREFRTVRRLSGSHDYLPQMADCERGLGRPERALELASGPDAKQLTGALAAELQIVAAGARLDMGEPAAAMVTLQRIKPIDEETRVRVAFALVDAMKSLGRDAEADKLAATLPDLDALDSEDTLVVDLATEPEPEPEPAPDPQAQSELEPAAAADTADHAAPESEGEPRTDD